jgi:GTP 3',8-cyclase
VRDHVRIPAKSHGEPSSMTDVHGRRIEYLRVSVTDKCNLRCVYCMPEEGLPWIPKQELLSFPEIERIVREMAARGLRRVRITGGEPLVRPGIPELVTRLRSIPEIEDLSISTNALLLAKSAAALRAAGVDRVNVSLDSLRPERADRIARRPKVLERVMEGIEAAEAVGFDPIKLNVVLLRGRNDDEVEEFAELTRTRPWHVRFIEIMPTSSNLALSVDGYVSCKEVLDRLRALGGLEPAEGPAGNGPATYFRYPGAPGTVGVITPMSHAYCDRCNRMRLTADGQLRPCLFGDLQTDLRTPLRAGRPIWPLVERTLAVKPERHHLVSGSAVGSGGLVALSQTGG